MRITYKHIETLNMKFNFGYEITDIGMPEDYKADLKDFIQDYRNKLRHPYDILWIVLRMDFLSEQDLRLFAVWCASQVKHLMTHDRLLRALEVAEDFAFGKVGGEELLDVRKAIESVPHEILNSINRSAASEFASEAAYDVTTYYNTNGEGDFHHHEPFFAFYVAQLAARAASYYASRDFIGPTYFSTFASIIYEQVNTVLKLIDAPNGEWFLKLKQERI